MEGETVVMSHDHDEEIELIRSLVDTVPAMLGFWDTDQRCHFANKAFEIWFGKKAESFIGTPLKDFLGSNYSIHLPKIEGVLLGKPQEFEQEIPDPRGGPSRIGHIHFIPKVVNDEVRGFFSFVADITQRKRLEESLQQAKEQADALATHDALTHLPNRLLLEDRLMRSIHLAQRQKRRCAVLYLDLDDFKKVNDTMGHAAGDTLLCEIAKRLVNTLRKSDTVARLGGDEFVILLPDLEFREQAGVVAAKLLAAMTHTPFPIGSTEVIQKFSVGIAIYPDDRIQPRELLECADAALYRAKEAGRNTYSFFSNRPPRP